MLIDVQRLLVFRVASIANLKKYHACRQSSNAILALTVAVVPEAPGLTCINPFLKAGTSRGNDRARMR